MSRDQRLPEHERALHLFAHEHFDVDTARALAIDELRQRQHLGTNERPTTPPERQAP